MKYVILYEISRMRQYIDKENRLAVGTGWGEGRIELLNDPEFSFAVMKMFGN